MFRKAYLPAGIPSAFVVIVATLGVLVSPRHNDALWGIVFLICVGLFIYFAPTTIAALQGNPNYWSILALNIFSFTFLLWVGALVWSLMPQRTERLIETGKRTFSNSEELSRLSALRSSGALTEEEFTAAKRRLLE